jgi:hypothetical protein
MFPRVCVVSCLPTLLVKEEPLHEEANKLEVVHTHDQGVSGTQ